MRKFLCTFLAGLLLLSISIDGRSATVPRFNTRDTLNFHGIKIPYTGLKDSIQTVETDTIHHKKHRLVAALLAFPLGVFGLHRAYLGTSTKVPIIYIVTLGGGLGILPFIDFVMILLSKDKEFHTKYTYNNYIFMWHKK